MLRTPHFELLVLCWRPGQHSTIHDHAGALNAIRVRSGELTSRVFRPAAGAAPGGGPVEFVSEEHVGPGDPLVGVDRGGIHQLADTSGEPLVTVHVYAPPLLELTVYDTETAGRREAVAALQPRARPLTNDEGAAPVRPARPPRS